MLDPLLTEAISDVFGVPADEITPDASHETVEEWDSVGHLKLILRVEEVFKVRFPTSEIPELTSAGKIQSALQELKRL